jgi:hypothetical protein
MDQLHIDLLKIILQPFQRSAESFLLRLVCKQWNAILEVNRNITLQSVLNYYAHEGYLSLLKWLK